MWWLRLVPRQARKYIVYAIVEAAFERGGNPRRSIKTTLLSMIAQVLELIAG